MQKSYREEAGQAELLESRLTADYVDLMKSIQTPEGALEDQRAAVQKSSPTAADALKARNRWIRTINAMFSLIELIDEPGEAVRTIVKRFQHAAAKAEVNHAVYDDPFPVEKYQSEDTFSTQVAPSKAILNCAPARLAPSGRGPAFLTCEMAVHNGGPLLNVQ